MLTMFTAGLIAGAAVALGLIDKALSPDMGHYPCAHPFMRWAIRFYVLTLVARAATLAVYAHVHPDTAINPFVLLGALGAFSCHTVLLVLLLRARLPHGVWPRLVRRLQYVQRVAAVPQNSPGAAIMAADGVPATTILRSQGVSVAPPGAGPESLLR